jgi:hypothetical protein
MVSVSGYLIGNQEAGKLPLTPKDELQWWYQFYFATERGRPGDWRRDPESAGRVGARLGKVSELTIPGEHSN